jgi:hypothetical protein
MVVAAPGPLGEGQEGAEGEGDVGSAGPDASGRGGAAPAAAAAGGGGGKGGWSLVPKVASSGQLGGICRRSAARIGEVSFDGIRVEVRAQIAAGFRV